MRRLEGLPASGVLTCFCSGVPTLEIGKSPSASLLVPYGTQRGVGDGAGKEESAQRAGSEPPPPHPPPSLCAALAHCPNAAAARGSSPSAALLGITIYPCDARC